MKTLSINEMETVNGGGIIDGICGVIGFSAAGFAVRSAVARFGVAVFFAIPAWGQLALAAGAASCILYKSS